MKLVVEPPRKPARVAGSAEQQRQDVAAVRPRHAEPNRREGSPRGRGKRLKQVALWCRQLCVLIKSGTTLAQALAAVERQTPSGPWHDVLSDVRMQLDEGMPLSGAMARHPDYFDAVCCSLVAAGEASGQLDVMLERLAQLLRQQLRIRRSLIGALIYPTLLIVVALAVMTAMLGFVLPRFTGLFETLDVPLPPTTKMLMAVSDAMRANWWIILLALASLAVGGKLTLASEKGHRAIEGWLLRLPYVGPIMRNFSTGSIARLLGALVQSRVPLLEALQLTRDAVRSTIYVELLDLAEEAVVQGENMSSVFGASPLISPSVTEALRHGEQSGQIGSVLTDMADFIDEENEAVVRALTSVLEPVILIVLGAFVAFVTMSMFIPLFDLTAIA